MGGLSWEVWGLSWEVWGLSWEVWGLSWEVWGLSWEVWGLSWEVWGEAGKFGGKLLMDFSCSDCLMCTSMLLDMLTFAKFCHIIWDRREIWYMSVYV